MYFNLLLNEKNDIFSGNGNINVSGPRDFEVSFLKILLSQIGTNLVQIFFHSTRLFSILREIIL
jgi:hypothetical protein